ncbi:MAG: archease [Candidatus Heimdallarchaeota archaeon]|nr:archease [Candidatus Heimdallarchaeota archaeon]
MRVLYLVGRYMSFEFLEHTADIIIKAHGENLKEAFEQAALGFYEVLTDLSQISAEKSRSVSISSEDNESLLYDWINELIFIFDTEFFVASEVTITNFVYGKNGEYSLEANLMGEEFNPSKHEQGAEVKAITYSYMEITDKSVEFTLDL